MLQKLNDLESDRPTVWINEICWHEMNVDDELTLRCESDWARQQEMEKAIQRQKALQEELARVADELLLTKPDSERAAEPGDLKSQLRCNEDRGVHICSTVAEALELVQRLAGIEDLIVVAGSLYLVGELRKLLVGEVI